MGELGQALDFTLLVGAVKEATRDLPRRRAALIRLAEGERLPALVSAGRWDEARALVLRVMPPGWEPPEEWTLPDIGR